MTQLISSGSPTEVALGFSRAVVAGGFVHVSGSSGLRRGPDGTTAGDAADQFAVALTKVAGALTEAGCSLADVVSTRVYLTDPADFDAIGKAHGEAFGTIRPACTMVVVAGLIDPLMLVEVEALALLPEAASSPL